MMSYPPGLFRSIKKCLTTKGVSFTATPDPEWPENTFIVLNDVKDYVKLLDCLDEIRKARGLPMIHRKPTPKLPKN